MDFITQNRVPTIEEKWKGKLLAARMDPNISLTLKSLYNGRSADRLHPCLILSLLFIGFLEEWYEISLLPLNPMFLLESFFHLSPLA